MSAASVSAAPRRCASIRAVLLAALLCWLVPVPPALAADDGRVVLDGHVPAALARATRLAPKAADADARLSFTVVLRRSDPAGFARYLDAVQDPASPQFRVFLSPREVSDRFGPSAEDAAQVRRHFAAAGLALIEASDNRLTLVFEGTRAQAQAALGAALADYELDGRRFAANAADPRLPAQVARRVQAVAGLSTLARPQPQVRALVKALCTIPGNIAGSFWWSAASPRAACEAEVGKCTTERGLSGADGDKIKQEICAAFSDSSTPPSPRSVPGDGGPVAWKDADGAGQTIGIVAFDTYQRSDVADYLALYGIPAAALDRLSDVHVGGGASAGDAQSEVLLDIDTVLLGAPGAAVVVYDAPFTGAGTFQNLFNRMVNDGVSIISNSWAYCEDQTSAADVAGIDAVLAAAAASGVTVFNASGDSGSTCLNGSPDTIAVPAGSPHAVAVGGTTLLTGAHAVFDGEVWWDGSTQSPPGGQGGFGTSRFFARPDYQDGFSAAPMRSIPDVAFQADPYEGVTICQASAGGCPAPLLFGGTSVAAPAWAAAMAQINQALGENVGDLNRAIYPLASGEIFHTAAELGADFARVGLGSPKFNALYLALAGAQPGPASAAVSRVEGPLRSTYADGEDEAEIVVRLKDEEGNSIRGRTVTLSASPGSHAVVAPASAVSSGDDGAVVFGITDATIENVVFTAHDVSDGLTLAQSVEVDFVVPPAASAGILAFPATVAANGADAATITITLRDALDRPTPGKEIALSQDGRSIVTGPTPPLTDENGRIVFTATDTFAETVAYTAVDVSDGGLPVPGAAMVEFTGSGAGSCALAPSAADGYVLEPFANGFAPYPFFFGNINFGCRGATDAAFDVDGNAYVPHFQTGALYRFGPAGGAATTPLATGLGPSLGAPVFGRDGRLYATHAATTGNWTTGDIVELDPASGALLRQVAANLICPTGLAVDPLSGDLFFTDSCFGAGSEHPGLFRITDPGESDPDRPTEAVVYATLPRTPNGMVAFAPDGTIYVESGYLDAAPAVVSVTGTDQPQPPLVAAVPSVTSIYWINVGAAEADGAARSLLVSQYNAATGANDLNLIDITTDPPQVTTLAHEIGSGTIGPDGCLYAATPEAVYRLAPEAGGCDFAATNPAPALALEPRSVAPNPQQGAVQTLTARFRNLDAPEGTAVYLYVRGANPQRRLGRTGADGSATLAYEGRFAGADVAQALAAVGDATLMSNEVRLTWDAGPHASFVTILAPAAASAGVPVTVRAALADVAVEPQAPIAGASLHASAGAASCEAVSGSDGVAACDLVFAEPGVYTLNVGYAGSSPHLPANASGLVVVAIGGPLFSDGFEAPE